MTRVSIRLRLSAWYATVLALGLGLFGFAMWLALEHRLIAGVDTRLDQRARGLRAALGAEADIRTPAGLRQEFSEFAGEIADGTLMELRDSAGYIFPVPSRTALLGGAPRADGERLTLEHGGSHYRLLVSSLSAAGTRYEVHMAMPLDDVRAVLGDFERLLLLMIPAVLALAGLGGYWLSVRALRPVDAITTVARSISVQNLSQRVQVPPTGDELQRMAETWNVVLERLEASVKRIRTFTADASHELRTPLALIRATAELALRRERTPAEYRDALRDIAGDVEHLTQLTESLLSAARADAGTWEMPLERIDLNPLAESVTERYQALAVERTVELHAEIAAGPAPALANETGIRRVLAILVDNALKYTPAGGRVTVAVEKQEAGVLLSVRDTGEGIPPAALPHIFDRFYRADAARGGEGFGLGLSIAQAIAEAHGGKLEVESAPGQGSRFHLRLRA
ncbi:MAG: HAMP domain-containing protein [Acidobacteria bacterium]|nr:HAMP domain-containing protein [Acidobacteriota bacterium]